MYYILYDLLLNFLYGSDAVLTGDQTLTLTFISTLGALFVVALPFIIVGLIVIAIVKLFL